MYIRLGRERDYIYVSHSSLVIVRRFSTGLNSHRLEPPAGGADLVLALIDVLSTVRAGRDVGGRTRIGLEGREGRSARLLEILGASAGGESGGLVDGGRGRGNGLRAVDELGGVLAGDGELLHGSLEVVGHQSLVVDVRLPVASSARVASEEHVGLKTHLTLGGEGREGFTGVVGGSREADSLE